MVNFVLTQFNTNIAMTASGETEYYIPVQDLSFDATGVIYVKTSNMKSIFKYSTDCASVNDLSNSDIRYYVYSSNFENPTELNPAHAMMDITGISENPILTEDSTGDTIPANKMLVKHDFLRYISLKLFNTGHGVDLFDNEIEMSQNMSLIGGVSYSSCAGYQILNSLYKVDVSGVNPNGVNENLVQDSAGLWYMTDQDTSDKNICREIFYQLGQLDVNRISQNVQDTTLPQSIPFEDGDTLMFTMNVNAAENQENLTELSDVIPPRSYLIKMVMVADNSLATNTVVVDDKTVSYEEVSATISSGATSTSDTSTNTFDFTGNTNRDILIEEPAVVSTQRIIRNIIPTKRNSLFDILEGYVTDIIGPKPEDTFGTDTFGGFGIVEDTTDQQNFNIFDSTTSKTSNARDITESYTTNFSLDADLLVNYIIVGGGGGGGGGVYGSLPNPCGGAGGGGGQVVSGKSLLKANETYYITIGAGGAGGTGGNTAGTAGYDGAYSSFIGVSALGGIGGQGGKFLTTKTKLAGGVGFIYNSAVIGTGGYGVNGNATHDADIRAGQDGVLIEYSSGSTSYVSGGGAGGASTEGYVSATNSLGGNGVGGNGAVGGANCVAGTVGGQNTGGGGGGGGASSDEINVDCIDGYSGGSGRVIIWCDKYIVTDTLYNTSLSVSDLSSTALSVKYSNYYKPAIKFNTSWFPNTPGSYSSSTTNNYVEIHGLLPNTEYSVYGMVETSLGNSLSVYKVHSTPPETPVITAIGGVNQIAVYFGDELDCVKNSYTVIWKPNTSDSYSYVVDCSYVVIVGLDTYADYSIYGIVTTNGATSPVSDTIVATTQTSLSSFSVVSYEATTAEFEWDGSFSNITIVWSADSEFSSISGSNADMYGNTGGVMGLVGNQITYFKALSYSDVGVIGVESNSVSFRTFANITSFSATLYTLSSIIINWDGSYSTIQADWGDTADFSGDYQTLSGITENYMVAENLSIGVLYYFRITPTNDDGVVGIVSTTIPMSTSYMPTITSLVTNVLSTSSVSLTWDGSYSLVNIVVSTDSFFTNVFYSVNSLDASTKTVAGMTAGTNYYVKITPHGTGFVGPISTITTVDTIPQLTGYSVSSYDSSSVLVSWVGSCLNGTLIWNTTNSFSVNDSSMNGLSGVSSSQIITGLTSNQIYYVKMIPYTTSNVVGTFLIGGATTSFKTLSATTRPIVNTFSTSAVTTTTSLLTWSGVLTSVDIYWDTSGTFIGSANLSAITGTTRTVTGLSSNTKYYFKIIPKSSAAEYGVPSSVLNITTLPIINTFTSSAVDTSAISVVFSGSFSTVDVFWNTTNDFSTAYSSKTGITASPSVISGLSPNLLYYFKITPYSSISVAGATSLTNCITKPYVSSFGVAVIDSSTAVLTWDGSLNTTDILWNNTGSTFSSTDNRIYSVSGLTKTIVGLDSSSVYYFVIIPKNASSVMGVSSEIVSKTTYYYPLITSSNAVAVDTSSVAITHGGVYSHVNIEWNTNGEIIDLSGSLTNRTTSPNYISGLSSNIKYYFTITPYYTLPSSLVITGSTLKLGELSTTAITATPVSISSSSYFSFTSSNYTSAVVSTATGNYAYSNGTYVISYSSQLTNASWAAVNAFNLYNSSLNWLSNSGRYNSSGVYIGTTSTFSSSMTISGEYIGIKLPYGLVLKEYNLARITSNATYNLSSYALVGSVDGIIWNTLDKQSLPQIDVSYTYLLGSNTKSYNYYRLIAISGLGTDFTGIRQLKLNGNTQTLSTSNAINTTTLAKITDFTLTARNSSSAIITYDGSYSNIKVLWNSDGVFNTSIYESAELITLNPYTVTDLLPNTRYYFALTPVSTSGVSGLNSSILNITTPAAITSFYATPDTQSSLQLYWDGSFSYVDIYWNTTNSETEFDGSSVGLTTSTMSLTGLDTNATYYFYMMPYNTIGVVGETKTLYATTLPVLSSVNIEIVDSLSLTVDWIGLYDSISLFYGTDPSFITVDGSLNGVYDTSASLIGLTPDTVYYFKLIPYNVQGDMGTVISDLSATTYYYPFVTSIVSTPMDTSSISLTFDGSYSDVYIQWNDTNLFADTDDVATYIMENQYTITNLQSNTTYYIGITPFFNTNTGRFGSTPIVTYDVSDTVVDILPIPTGTGVYASFSSNTLSVSGSMTYANGDYDVSASSQFNTTVWNPYSVFNTNTAYGWISKNGTYDKTNSGKYIGTVATTTVSGLSISGEWIQIQMPYYSIATSYVVESISSVNNLNCSAFSLVGSINGTDWYLLDTQTRTTPSTDYTGNISTNTESYRYYRVIATAGDPSMLINATGINGLFISGYYADRIQTGVFSTTTYPEITSYTTSDIYDTTFVLSWEGALSSIDVEWNYSGDFSSGSNSSITGLTGTTATIFGLLPSANAYVRIVPYSSSGLVGDYSEVFNVYTLSSVSSSTAAIDISNIYTIDVSFVGIYETVEIRRNTANTFSAENIVATGITEDTYSSTNLLPNTTYYFRITAYNANGVEGSYSDCSIKTFPIITSATVNSYTNSSVTVGYDGSYSSVSIRWDTDPLFTNTGNTTTGLTGTATTVSGLLSNTLYYFKLIPSNGTVAGGESGVLSATTKSKITSGVATPTDVSSISLTWDGSYSSVSVQWDTSNGFTTTDNSMNGLSTTNAIIRGLSANTKYYFRILSYSSTGEFGGYSDTYNAVTYPEISTFGGTYTSSAEVSLYWTGGLSTVDILRNTTGSFSPFVGVTTSGVSGLSVAVSGLAANTNYYFLIRPYSSGGSLGASSEVIEVRTKPAITSIASTSVDVSSIYVSWSGSYSSVDLLWNTTGTFRVSDSSLSGLTVSNTTINGLLAGTKYYFVVVPKTVAGVSGVDSAISSVTTVAEASITTTTGTVLGRTSAYITWSGLYDTVNVQWSTDESFSVIEGRANGLITNNYTINFLDEDTLYYYRVIPYYGTSARRENTVYSFNTDYVASVNSFVISATDTSSVAVAWDGSFSSVNLRWNTTNAFDVSDTVISGISKESSPYTISGLDSTDIYYFRISVYSIMESEYSNSGSINAVAGYDSSYSFVSSDVSATVDLVRNVDNSTDVSYITVLSKTGISELDISSTVDYYIRTVDEDIIPYYTPTISDSSISVIDNSIVLVSWGGFFTSVDVRWSSTDSSLNMIDGSINDIVGSSTTIYGLSGATVYYYEILPRLFNIINTDASINSFITYYEPYISDLSATAIDISGINLTWDGSYSAVDIYRNLTGDFDISDTIVSGITANTYAVTDLSVNTQYYFRLKLYGETGYEYEDSSSVSVFTDYIPFISDSTATAIDISTITLEFDGSYSTVNVLWNDDNTDAYNTISGIYGTGYTLSDLSSNVAYYFKIRPFNSTGYQGTDGDVITSTTSYTPEIYSSSLTVLTDTSIRIEWTGMYSVVDIELSLYESFNPVSNAYLDISGSSYTITGLLPNTGYFYRITPYYVASV